MICETCHALLDDRVQWCPHCDTPTKNSNAVKSYDYEAFISYRHVKADMKLASRIQKSIEGFRLPKNIADRFGTARLGKCFRDNDELPTASGLSQSIEEAIAHSKYLVVVCSPEARESQWISHEVELFASLHGRGRIILALAAGEPSDAFPELLLTKLVCNDKGEIEEADAEPIAADFRDGTATAFRNEILRIVAAIVGCGYDDLRQRMRTRRMKTALSIASGIAAVAIAFAGFSLFQQAQIVANLDQALRNQSEYLATESNQLYEQGDRMQAIQVALSALPDSESDNSRPYVPAAQEALEQALGIYPYTNVYHWESLYSHYEETDIESWAVSDDGSRYAVVDSLGNLVVRYVDTGTEIARANIAEYRSDYGYINLCFLGESVLFYSVGDEVYEFDPGTQAVRLFSSLSDYENDTSGIYGTTSFSANEVVSLGDNGIMAAISYPTSIVDSGGAICLLDATTGNVQELIALPELHGVTDFTYDTESSAVSPDGSKLAVCSYDTIATIDTESGKVVTANLEGYAVTDCRIEGSLLYIAAIATSADSESGYVDTVFMGFSLDSLEEAWTYRDTIARMYFCESGLSYLEPSVEAIEKAGGGERIYCLAGDRLVVLDAANGSFVSSAEAESPYKSVYIVPSEDAESYSLLALTYSGYLSCTTVTGNLTASDQGSLYDCNTGEEGAQAEFLEYEGAYYCLIASCEQSERTVLYRYGIDTPAGAQDFSAIKNMSPMQSSAQGSYISQESVSFSAGALDETSSAGIEVFSASDFSLACSIPIEAFGESASSLYLHFNEHIDKILYAYDPMNDTLFAINVENGEICGQYSNDNLTFGTDPFDAFVSTDDHLGVVLSDGDAVRYVKLDPNTLEVIGNTELNSDASEHYGSVIEANEYSGLVCLVTRSGYGLLDETCDYAVLTYDSVTGEERKTNIADCCVDYMGGSGTFAANPDGSSLLVACKDGKLRSFNASGTLSWERDFSLGESWFAFYLTSGALLVQDAGNQCFLIDAQTGNALADLPFSLPFQIQSAREFNGKLYVYADDGYIMRVGGIATINVNPEYFGCESLIPTAFALSQDATSVLACCHYSKVSILPVWTLNDEIAYAKELISGHELTASERGKYQIE